MVTKDFDILNDMVTLIDQGMLVNYEAFTFTMTLFEGYSESEMTLTVGGEVTEDYTGKFDGNFPLDLVKELKESVASRGEPFYGVTLSYTVGNQAKAKYINIKPEDELI